MEVCNIARAKRADLERHEAHLNPAQPDSLRQTVADLAAASGFWSVWRAVFSDDTDMLNRLNEGFQGTARDCFDLETSRPVPRPGGRL